MPITAGDAAHLLRRVGFGAKPAEIMTLAALPTWSDAVDAVLNTSRAPGPLAAPPEMGDPGAQDYWRWVKATQVWVDRMRTTPAPIVEKMALFWHGHFTSSREKVAMPLLWDQLQLYRTLALGDFHELTQRMAVHPAMLIYLDNSTNVARSPNENFGRELMELYLMGNGTFTEADVVAMSRAWTGHGTNSADTAYEPHPALHDDGQKTLFGITRNWDGPAAITEILRGSQAAVSSRYIAAKLWAYFAGTQATPALVDDLAAAFRGSGLSIRALVRAILMRPEFLSAEVRTGLVRGPIDWVVATARALGVAAPDFNPEWYLGTMGQEPFAPPNVSGWRSNSAWISTSSEWARARMVMRLRWIATVPDGQYKLFQLIEAKTAREIADTAITVFEISEPTANFRRVVEDWATRIKAPGGPAWSAGPNLILLSTLSPDFQMA